MRLATLDVYRKLIYAPGSEPSLSTLRRRIDRIPGGRIDMGRYYVDLDANDKMNQLSKDVDERSERLKRDPLLEGLI
jgi:hypothetical protein